MLPHHSPYLRNDGLSVPPGKCTQNRLADGCRGQWFIGHSSLTNNSSSALYPAPSAGMSWARCRRCKRDRSVSLAFARLTTTRSAGWWPPVWCGSAMRRDLRPTPNDPAPQKLSGEEPRSAPRKVARMKSVVSCRNKKGLRRPGDFLDLYGVPAGFNPQGVQTLQLHEPPIKGFGKMRWYRPRAGLSRR